MSEAVVRAEKHKWPGGARSAADAVLVECGRGRVAWRTAGPGADQVQEVLVATRTGAWWIASLGPTRPGDPIEVRIDIATPVRVGAGVVSFIDLDLDLVGPSLDDLELRDVDEFLERVHALGYPPWLVAGAWRGLADARRCVAARRWPFDGTVAPRRAAAARAQAVCPCTR